MYKDTFIHKTTLLRSWLSVNSYNIYVGLKYRNIYKYINLHIYIYLDLYNEYIFTWQTRIRILVDDTIGNSSVYNQKDCKALS